MMELGPAGYSFEKFIGEIFKSKGYDVKVGTLVEGKCIQHEIDVIAKRDNKQLMIECKYHNQQGTVSDVKIPLYIHSRFKDVEAQWLKTSEHKNLVYQGCVVTNTRFSIDAIQYGACSDLKLIGWDYPAKECLRDQIDSLGLYPITCLTSLTKSEKQQLLDKKIVLCKEINNNSSILQEIGLKSNRIEIILQETHQLCQIGVIHKNSLNN